MARSPVAVDGSFSFHVTDNSHRVTVGLRLQGEEEWVIQRHAGGEAQAGDENVRIELPALSEVRLRFASAQTDEDLAVSGAWIWVQRRDGTFVMKGELDPKRPITSARVVVLEEGTFDVIVEAEGHGRVRLSRLGFTAGKTIRADVPLRPRSD